MPSPDEIPSGICECGCGEQTNIVSYTDRKRGLFKGYPARRLPGHSTQASGADHPNWKGGTMRTSAGYVLEHSPGHPEANKYGYVRQHRLVMERSLGRALRFDEVVHHVNGIKDDNRVSNLEVMTVGEHNAEHAPLRRYNSDVMRAAGLKGAGARWGRKYD